MSISGRKAAIRRDWELGVRRCPCCNVQLVWKGVDGKPTPKNLATVDHIVAKSMGGCNSPNNLLVICRECNRKRGNSCFVDFATEKGIPRKVALELFKTGAVSSIKVILRNMFINKNYNITAGKVKAEKIGSRLFEVYGEIPDEIKIIPYSKELKIG